MWAAIVSACDVGQSDELPDGAPVTAFDAGMGQPAPDRPDATGSESRDGGLLPMPDAAAPKRDAASCTTCEADGGQYCGLIGNGCGEELDCGECRKVGYGCGARGIAHVCGASSDSGVCTPTVCQQPTGKYCGKIGDGCGGQIDCGGCDDDWTCGGAGIAHVCGAARSSGKCRPITCGTIGSQYCGTVGDGCGGTLDCGGCPSGQTCGARMERLCGTPCPLCSMVQQCGGTSSTILRGVALTGAATDPDPLYDAVVFVPNVPPGTKLPPLRDGPSCDRCTPLSADESVTSAITAADGSFELRDVPIGPGIPLVLQLGRWRRQITVDVQPCTENILPLGALRLPRNHQEGDIPLTAIATGDVDRLQCLLRKIGIDDSEFTNPEGDGRMHMYVSNGSTINDATPEAAKLTGTVEGQSEWNKYSQVILPCVGREIMQTPAALANFLDYVNKGGRAFATHFSYTWLFSNGSLAGTGEWQPRQETPVDPLTATIDTSFKKGTDFAAWLQSVNALSSAMPPQLQISEPRHDLNAIPSKNGGLRWIYSDDPATVQHYTIDTPVGAQGDQLCGRVVFSDFHVLNAMTRGLTFPEECDGEPLSAQEKVLEFMLFDLASCIGQLAPPAPPPPAPPPPAAPPPPLPPPPLN